MDLNVDKFIPGHSVSCVVFGFEDGVLKILVLKWKGADLWTVPVGFIGKNTNLDEAARDVLENRTGIKLPFLEQFHTFGSAIRRKNSDKKMLLDTFKIISA